MIAALSGEVSLVAVLANLLVAPVVGPATVLGLAGGLFALVWDPLGRVAGRPAGVCVGWIVRVAEWGADLPAPSVRWGSGALALAVLAPCAWRSGSLRPRCCAAAGCGVALVVGSLVVVLGVPGTDRVAPGGLPHGWPPRDWVLAVCDVGQGDALAISVGPRTAIVVDAGPDPELVDRCLDDLDVTVVPLLVLTHFHADHVAGLEGVLRGRSVAAVEASPMLDPSVGCRRRRARPRGSGASRSPWRRTA